MTKQNNNILQPCKGEPMCSPQDKSKRADTQLCPDGYKNSPLGIIPEDWEVKRLDEVCEIDSRSLSSKTAPDYSFNYISLSDVDSEVYEMTKTKQVFKTAPSRARRIVQKGDVIISTVRPNLQGFSIIRDKVEDLIVSTGFSVLTPKKCNSMYLYSYMFSEYTSKQFYQLIVGSNYPAVNSSDVANLKIVLPPLPEQQKIAEILGLWDSAIEKQTQLIEKLELRKKGLMQQLLLHNKAKSFNRIKAGDIFKSVSIKGNDNEPLLSATQEYGVIPRDMLDGRVTMPTGDTKSFKLVEKGDFVISLRSFQGGIEYSNYRGLVSPAYTVLKPKIEINNEYYRQYFKSADFIGRLAVAVIGIRDGKQISYEDFCIVKIPNTSIIEQNRITSILSTADREIETEKAKLEQLRRQKKGLMQVLLTGKKRVK